MFFIPDLLDCPWQPPDSSDGRSVHTDSRVSPARLGISQRCLNWILELEVARLTIVGDGHHIHISVIKLNPGQLVSIRREVESLGVGQNLFLEPHHTSLTKIPNTDLVNPVCHTVEHHPGSAGGAHHDVLALWSVSVVDVGPEHIGDTGPLGAPHGQL